MKRYLLTGLLLLPLLATAGEKLEMDVHGMTCAFCVYSLEKKLGELPGVSNAEVSLSQNRLRLEAPQSGLDLELLRAAVRDAGFTPMEHRWLNRQ